MLKEISFKKKLKLTLFSSIIFFIIAFSFKALNLLPSITEIRPANAIAPVLGILFGQYGAIGVAIGNAAADILYGTTFELCTFGILINFFYSYIAYVFWYKINDNDKSEYGLPILNTTRKIIIYLYIVFFDSLMISAMLSGFMEFLSVSAYGEHYFMIFFNNFDFAALIGVPILAIVGNVKLPFVVPDNPNQNMSRCFPIFYICSVGVLWYIVSAINKKIAYPIIALIILITFVLALLIFYKLNRSMFKSKIFYKATVDKKTIKQKLLFWYLFMTIIFIIIISIITYRYTINDAFFIRWNKMLYIAGGAINIAFIISLAFLNYTEKKIVDPLTDLSAVAADFATHYITNLSIPNYKIHGGNDEIAVLSKSFYSMMTDISKYVNELKIATSEKEYFKAELSIASQIQFGFLPDDTNYKNLSKEVTLSSYMKTAKEVGGDSYDFFKIDDDHIALLIADASGKGISAAMFISTGKILIKSILLSGKSLCETCFIVNNQLCADNKADMFITAWIGVYEISTGKLDYVSAGHNAPLIIRDSSVEYMKMHYNMVLGGMGKTTYLSDSTYLNDNDIIYLYTDGVTEAMDQNQNLFGEERLRETIAENKLQISTDYITSSIEKLNEFVGNAEQSDDITVLSMRINSFNGIHVPAKNENLSVIISYIENQLNNYSCPNKLITYFCICLDELFSNIVSYAKTDNNPIYTTIKCGFLALENKYYISILDNGIPFDPTKKEPPNILLSAEEREIGGLGIFIVSRLMDKINYSYKNSMNEVTIYKNNV